MNHPARKPLAWVNVAFTTLHSRLGNDALLLLSIFKGEYFPACVLQYVGPPLFWTVSLVLFYSIFTWGKAATRKLFCRTYTRLNLLSSARIIGTGRVPRSHPTRLQRG